MPRITKKLREGLELIYSPCYPRQHSRPGSHRHQVLLGIGGNVGDTIRRFERLYLFWVKSPYITVIETSPILRNPPFGYLDQDDFYNALVYIRTDLTPMQLLDYILRVEKQFGRKRSFANAPRTLDIDMIFYDHLKIDKSRLTVPHPHWCERDSVMIPLQQMKGTLWSKRHL